MNRVFLFSALLGLCCVAGNQVLATNNNSDADRDITLDEIVISASIASEETPITQSTIDKSVLENSATGSKELPYLLQSIPGVVATSDNGLGIGAVYFKIRGTNDTRINITMDGVPLNSPEDHSVFWANMNSYSGSLESIQVQRGAGTSTNGTGAFGATVNMISEKPSLTPHIDAEGTMGSYNTYNGTIKAGSGLLFNHLVLDGRFSVTNSDGYIDRTKSHLGSYFTSASWYGNDYLIKLKNFGSFEHTGQAWNGVPSDSIKAGKRTYNSLGVFFDHKDRIHFRPTTDNYLQNHTHLSFIKNINDLWDAQATLFYTYGIGYYEDMKDNSNLAKKFGLNSYAGIEGDANRQKWLENNSVGGIFNVTRKSDKLDLTMGGGYQYFDGDHWGEFESIINSADSSRIDIGNAHYYDSNAKKSDANIYLKGVYHIGDNLHLFADAQYRYVNYLISGNNDVFIKDDNGKYHNQLLNIDETFHFFNPKAGISYAADWGNSYFSVAKIEREPTRNNYTDNGGSLMPKAETLYDYELGYNYKGKNWYAGFNLYYMDYKNQLIATGQLSDIGEALTENVKDSYRRGIEIEAGATLFDHISWNGNATFSQNKIVNFTEYVDNWEGNPLQIHYDETDIALSPNITAYSMLSASFLKGFNASITTNYVGRQYLDNSSCKERSLAPYCVTDFNISYTFHPLYFKEAKLNLQINNLFNEQYSSNGWVYTAVSESYGYTAENRYVEDGLFVQAPISFLTTLTLKF